MLYCSFCGKCQDQVRKLIAGPSVHICNECADLCHEIAHEAPGAKPPLPAPQLPEALHLASVFGEVTTAANKAAGALYDFHMASRKAEEPAEPAEVVGFGTRTAGWAEGVATPDSDVGFAFTPLGSGFTGLPVNISVGDDVPLVIAAVGALTAEEIAEVRRWVVRHQADLAAHWRNEIDSAELIERLRSLGRNERHENW